MALGGCSGDHGIWTWPCEGGERTTVTGAGVRVLETVGVACGESVRTSCCTPSSTDEGVSLVTPVPALSAGLA